jgi:hypothetical protein
MRDERNIHHSTFIICVRLPPSAFFVTLYTLSPASQPVLKAAWKL